MTQTSASAWNRPIARLATAAALTALIATTVPAAPAGAFEQLDYRITHAVFGDIGTYSNTVEPTGDGTTVKTRTDIHVKVLGANLYSEEAQRTERWQGNRLVAFHGITRKDSGSTEIRGAAHGDSFVITTPQGTVTAPKKVHPANPWSANFVTSDTMMRPDTGKLEQVSVSRGSPATVTINNQSIPAWKYDVDGATRYSVWFDHRGIPLKFVVADQSGTVTFTLAHCTNCGLEVSAAADGNQLATQR